jgi:nucleotide-binding universal stress UspA family protein
MFHDVLVPTDLSEGGLRALRLAIKMVRETKGRLILLHVGVTPVPVGLESYGALSAELMSGVRDQIAQEQKHALEKLAREELPEGMEYRIALREGYPPDEICTEAKESGADLIVMGTHGRTGLERVFLGSVAERVIRQAEVPVLVTH